MMSLRKSLGETSDPSPAPKPRTLLAQFPNSVSWVTPRSNVTESYLVLPGDLRLPKESPPSRYLTISVACAGPTLSLFMPATYLPSHFNRNLKFLYGSDRCGFALNPGMISPFTWRSETVLGMERSICETLLRSGLRVKQ